MNKNNIINGQPPSQDELFFYNWARETLKENISILNDTLKIFITLDIAILSAYLGFWDKINTCNNSLKIIPPLSIMLSLISAVIGIYPTASRVNLNIPSEIKKYKIKRAKAKGYFLLITTGLMILGFIFFILIQIH